MRKSDRLFQLTNILRAHQPITAKRMAEKLSVTERTVYRYIDDLSVAGVPVYGEPGIGYRLSQGYELPPLQLTARELEALVAGVNFVTALTGTSLSSPALSLLSKIEASLPLGESSDKDLNRIVRFPGEYRHTLEYKKWSKLHNAIKAKEWVRITYISAAEANTVRSIFPLGLFYWGGKWIVGCWCDFRKDYRDFRLDRIQGILDPCDNNELPSHVSLTDYIALRESSTSY